MAAVTNNIKEYMNTHGKREYTYAQVSAIQECIRAEYEGRKNAPLYINTKTKEGRKTLNKRIASLVNEKLNSFDITYEDVHLYKKCKAEEYQHRTGRCAYGFKELRERRGYDPETGLETNY